MAKYDIELDDSTPDWVQITVTDGDVQDAERAAAMLQSSLRDTLGVPNARMATSVRVDGPHPVVTVRTHILGMLLMGKPVAALHGLLTAAGHQATKHNRKPLTAGQKSKVAAAHGQAAKIQTNSLD